jgi:predicted ATPase/class 3 adenylate cyclase/tetratricopeptide (TPR) repeat protein
VPAPANRRSTDTVVELPTGLVTFVFTDIEGSTRLLHRDAESYADAVDRHRDIIRDAVAEHHGHVMATENDSTFLVFAESDDAMAAARSIQEALAAEPWPEHCQLKVRIGAHCGIGSPRGYDYVTVAVHQAARVAAVGHGGQIVVTPEVVAELDERVAAELRPLGRYRVRDFDQPLQLWQFAGGSFPAVRAPAADHHNLLRRAGAMISRTAEFARLAEVCKPGAVVTLLGPGGVGKTRLSVEHGFRVLDQWPDGVWFVDLASVEDESAVLPTVLETIGEHGKGAVDDPLTLLTDALCGRRMLVVLDNAEHVRVATRQLVAQVVQRCTPESCLLVTSRERLGAPGEVVVRVDPLTVGDERAYGDAVTMFCDHMRRLDPQLLGSDEMSHVVQLCRRLDGLPLAIEMAAARTAAFRPLEILRGLEAAPSMLALPEVGKGERHHSFEPLLAWSETTLSGEERAVFRGLGVLAGSFGYDTAVAALSGMLPHDVVTPALWALVDKSLLVAEPGAGATRYRMLHTIRHVVRARMPLTEQQAIAHRLARWLDSLIGPDAAFDDDWLSTMADELDNVRGVSSLLAQREPNLAQRLAWSIANFLDATQGEASMLDDFQTFASQFTIPTPELVGLLARRADLLLRRGLTSQADALLGEADALRAQCPWDDVAVERTRGELLLREGRAADAAQLARAMLATAPSARGTARMHSLLGLALAEQGEWREANEAFATESLIWERVGNDAALANARGNVAEVLLREGRNAQAAAAQLECLELATRHGQPVMVAYSAIVAARVAAPSQRWPEIVELLAAATSLLSSIGEQMYETDQAAVDELLQAAAKHLGAPEVARICREPIGISEMMSRAKRTLASAAAS